MGVLLMSTARLQPTVAGSVAGEFVLALVGSVGEEVGWRGYALRPTTSGG